MAEALLFRLMVSSTFKDFSAERAALQARVFPTLSQYCAERGARFEAVDLRWGISEAAAWEHRTLEICLEELERCQRLSDGPAFLFLLGDRYGWQPLPARIPEAQYLQLAESFDFETRLLADQWYRPDRNAVPSVVRLRPRPSTMSEPAWQAMEAALLDGLMGAASRAGMGQSERDLLFASATHLEIHKGVLAADRAERAVGCLRHGGAATDQAPEVLAAMARLKDELRGHFGDRLLEYEAPSGTGDRTQGLGPMLDHIESELRDMIDAAMARRRATHSEAEVHRGYARRLAPEVIGREEDIDEAVAHAQSRRRTGPLLVVGDGGIGKSAVMAATAARLLDAGEPRLLVRFAGVTPAAGSVATVLDGLRRELIEALGLATESVGDPVKDLAAALASVPDSAPVVLMLDGLEQLDPRNLALALSWLPAPLPAHVRVILSLRPEAVADLAIGQGRVLPLEPLAPADGARLLDQWLAAAGRRLTEEQREQVLAAAGKAVSPLYLRLAFGAVRDLASDAGVPRLAPDIPGMIRALIDGLADDSAHGPQLTHKALAFIAASRFGLAETELQTALAADPAVMAAFRERSSHHAWDRPGLPPIIWSRLRYDLGTYLVESLCDGMLLYRFFHGAFAAVIAEDGLSGAQGAEIHARLANVFARPAGPDLYRRARQGDPAALRAVMERPYQLRRGGLDQDHAACLADFDFLMAKCAGNRTVDLVADFDTVPEDEPVAGPWRNLITVRAPLLALGEPQWSADRILFQVAEQQAPESPIAAQVQAWLATDRVDWPRLCRVTAPLPFESGAPAFVFSDHGAMVHGARPLGSGLVASWDDYGRILIWDPHSGQRRHRLECDGAAVLGGVELEDGSLVVWCAGGSIIRWDVASGRRCQTVSHGAVAVTALAPDQTLSIDPGAWSLKLTEDGGDGRIPEILGPAPGAGGRILVLRGQPADPEADWFGLSVAADRSILAWGRNRVASWDGEGRTTGDVRADFWDVCAVAPDGRAGLAVVGAPADAPTRRQAFWLDWPSGKLRVEPRPARGALPLGGASLLCWGESEDLLQYGGAGDCRIWSGHKGWPIGGRLLPSQRLATWDTDGAVIVRDRSDGRILAEFADHAGAVLGLTLLPDGRLLSWGEDGMVSVRPPEAADTRQARRQPLRTIRPLDSDRLAGWTDDGCVMVWSTAEMAVLTELKAAQWRLAGIAAIGADRLATWGVDEPAHLWSVPDGIKVAQLAAGPVDGVIDMGGGALLSWGADPSPRLWDAGNGAALGRLTGHRDRVLGAEILTDGNLLTWSQDGSLRLWGGDGSARAVWTQGRPADIGGAMILDDGRIATWPTPLEGHVTVWPTGGEAVFCAPLGPGMAGLVDIGRGRLAGWTATAEIGLWDVGTGRLLWRCLSPHGSVSGAWVGAAEALWTWSHEAGVAIRWDLGEGQPVEVRDLIPAGFDWNRLHPATSMPNGLDDIAQLEPELARAIGRPDGRDLPLDRLGWRLGARTASLFLSGPGGRLRWFSDKPLRAVALTPGGHATAVLANQAFIGLELRLGSRAIDLAALGCRLVP